MARPRVTLEFLYSKEGMPCLAKYRTCTRQGAFSRVAAAQLGIAPTTLSSWLTRGKAEWDQDKDTLYAQFYTDTLQDIAEARARAEGMIMEDNPLMWLKKGPGKYLGDDWSDTPHADKDGNLVEYEIDGTQTIKVEHKEVEQSDESQRDEIMQTLIELKKSGISLDQLVEMVMEGEYDIKDGLGPLIERTQEENIQKYLEEKDDS